MTYNWIMTKVTDLKPGDFISSAYTGNPYGTVKSVEPTINPLCPGTFDIDLGEMGAICAERGDFEYLVDSL